MKYNSHKPALSVNAYLICFLLLYCLRPSGACCQQTNAVEYVNPFIGTSSSNVFTKWGNEGGTFPGAVAPWGYFQLTPETRQGNNSGYDYKDSSIRYFSCMQHHSGFPGGSAGKLHIMAVIDARTVEQGRRFLHRDEHAEPGYYRVLLRDDGTLIEAAATVHAGIFRIRFPAGTTPRLFIGDAGILSMRSALEMEGRTGRRFSRNGEQAADTQNILLLRFNRAVTDTQRVAGGSIVQFAAAAQGTTVLTVALSASATGYESARNNLDTEISGQNFEQIREQTKKEWNRQLSVVRIDDPSEDNKTIFYTALYHSLLLPWIISDANGYYKGQDGQIHKTNGNAEFGGFSPWDTFRSLHPLLCLLYPGMQADMLRSMMDIYRQSGYLPVESMTGNHSIPILVDSYLKGIKNIDSTLLYEAMKKSIVTGPFIQKDMVLYQQGFIPYPYSESVTRTVEYTYDDWALAQFAGQVMHDHSLYMQLMQRSRNYRHLFNTEELCLLPRKGDQFYHGTGNAGYKEGDQWVYTYFLPHYQRDLINLLGTDDNFVQGMDAARQDNRIVFDNETMLHVPYLLNSTAYPYKTQQWVHDIMLNRYSNSPGGLPGNDDLGAMSSWFVWSALGLYPVCPGNPVYAIGTPLFREATLILPKGKTWKISAKQGSQKNFYVKSIAVNGRSYHDKWLAHSTVVEGGNLLFGMTGTPDKEKSAGLIPGETDSLMHTSIYGFRVRSRRVLPDAPLWVRFSLDNTGAAGTVIIKLRINDSITVQKNCFIENNATLQDSLLCRLYAYGGNKLQIDGLPSEKVFVYRSKHGEDTSPQITQLQASPVTGKGLPIYYNYIVKNTGGEKHRFIIPVRLDGKRIRFDTAVLKPGDSCKKQHAVMATLQEGIYVLQAGNNQAKIKIYTKAENAIVLDIPGEIVAGKTAKDISGFGNDGYKAEEGNYTSLPHTASLDSNGTTLTIMAWIYDTGERRGLTDLIAKGDNHVLQLSGRSNLSFFAGGWGRGDCTVPLPSEWRNHWHQIAGVCTGADLRVYIDGELKGITPLEKVINLNVAAAWSIGGNEEFPLNRSFNGRIRDVKIFTSPLTAADIKAIYEKERSGMLTLRP